MTARLTWAARSGNVKTGNIPTAWISGGARATCQAVRCPLYGKGCYAWSGTPRFGLDSHERSGAAGANQTVQAALANRHKGAKIARVTAIGDVAPIADDVLPDLVAIAEAGLTVVGYTHGWRIAPSLRPFLLASTESATDADAAADLGWRVALVVPASTPDTGARTPAGRPIVICPAQREGRAITCNACRLCNASKRGPVVGFRAHGNQASAAESATS